MHQQKIKVNTKGGLLSAFECAKSVGIPTTIILVTKSKDVIFNLTPFNTMQYLTKKEWNLTAERPRRMRKSWGIQYQCKCCKKYYDTNGDAILCCFDQYYAKIGQTLKDYNKSIERAKRNIRRIPAKDLLR